MDHLRQALAKLEILVYQHIPPVSEATLLCHILLSIKGRKPWSRLVQDQELKPIRSKFIFYMLPQSRRPAQTDDHKIRESGRFPLNPLQLFLENGHQRGGDIAATPGRLRCLRQQICSANKDLQTNRNISFEQTLGKSCQKLFFSSDLS